MSVVGVNVAVDASAAARALGVLSTEGLKAAIIGGLYAAGVFALGEIDAEYTAKGLKTRTATLAQSVSATPAEEIKDYTTYVGVPGDSAAAKYAYLLGDESVTIVPVENAALTIPIAENLTGAGDTKFATVADLKRAYGVAVERRGRAIGVVSGKGKREKFEAYFALVASVTIKGRNVLRPAVERALPEMTRIVQERVDSAIADAQGGGAS